MGNVSTHEAAVKSGDMIEGRYRIIKSLGAGGMGAVFLAEHVLIKRRVAMKILHRDLATDANVVERFMNEARAAGTLGHPNIVESTDMGFTHDHVPYIVFEYLEGTLLTDEIYRVGGLPVRRAMWIAEQIASALHAAHTAGIIHRDLKNDNVFLTDRDDALDHVKVLDFGISRFLEIEERQRNLVIGTPEFMAPEQIVAPDTVDRRTDVYALGVIIYEMLTARRPFGNEDDPRQLMHRIVHETPPPLLRPEVPSELGALVLDRMLAKDVRARPQSMADVLASLEPFHTRDDGSSLPRRRSAPMAVVGDGFDQPTSLRLPTSRGALGGTDLLDGATPLATEQIVLPPPPFSKRPVVMYGTAVAGVLTGVLGFIVGLRGGNAPAPQSAPAAAPIAQPAQPATIPVSLDADVPGARVVFRRRVADAPVAMEINATDVIELVEVSAPGHKTTRYWLTFDRPTHLAARLVPGTGMIEASEAETVAALGDVPAARPPPVPQTAEVAPRPQPPTP